MVRQSKYIRQSMVDLDRGQPSFRAGHCRAIARKKQSPCRSWGSVRTITSVVAASAGSQKAPCFHRLLWCRVRTSLLLRMPKNSRSLTKVQPSSAMPAKSAVSTCMAGSKTQIIRSLGSTLFTPSSRMRLAGLLLNLQPLYRQLSSLVQTLKK